MMWILPIGLICPEPFLCAYPNTIFIFEFTHIPHVFPLHLPVFLLIHNWNEVLPVLCRKCSTLKSNLQSLCIISLRFFKSSGVWDEMRNNWWGLKNVTTECVFCEFFSVSSKLKLVCEFSVEKHFYPPIKHCNVSSNEQLLFWNREQRKRVCVCVCSVFSCL